MHSWPGKNGFWCNGKYIKGADWYKCICTSAIIIASSIVTIVFPGYGLYLQGYYSPILVICPITACTLHQLFVTATSDPGYIPKQIIPFAPKCSQDLNEHISKPKSVLITLKNVTTRLKFCQTCMIYRPPRCSHCSVCNLCVENFDHHCPWIGNCIGKRNYLNFFLFIFFSSLLSVAVFTTALCFSVYSENEFTYIEVISIVISAFAFIVMVFILLLLAFHVYLLVNAMTTNEKMKDVWPGPLMNPFNQSGILKHIKEKWLEFQSKKQFNIKAKLPVYQHDIDANFTHRGVIVLKSLLAASSSVEENVLPLKVNQINILKE